MHTMYDVTAALGALPDVFTAQTAMAAGISHHVLRRLVRHKSIIRFQSGVYGQLRVDEPEQERWARIHREHTVRARAALLAHPDHALSHRSGALVFGWPVSLYPDEPVHLTALRGGATDFLAVEASLDGMRRWRGRPKANAALRLVDPRRESWLESFSFVVLHGLGIDLPTPQVEVFDEWGQFVGRVDGMWIAEGTVAEADGQGKYLLGTPSAVAPAARMPPAEWSPRNAVRTTCGISGWRWCVGARTRCVVRRTSSRGVWTLPAPAETSGQETWGSAPEPTVPPLRADTGVTAAPRMHHCLRRQGEQPGPDRGQQRVAI